MKLMKETLKLNQLLPESTDRACLVGTTGCGKTTLAEYICKSFKYVVCLDPKNSLNWKGFKKIRGTNKRDNLSKLFDSKEEKLIYTPSAFDLKNYRDENGVIAKFFEWVYWRENCLLYIDETSSVTDSTYIPYGLFNCLVRGREKNIMTITSTQRPSRIRQEILSETDVFYVFRLQLKADREKVEGVTDISRDFLGSLKKREFVRSQYGENTGKLTLKL